MYLPRLPHSNHSNISYRFTTNSSPTYQNGFPQYPSHRNLPASRFLSTPFIYLPYTFLCGQPSVFVLHRVFLFYIFIYLFIYFWLRWVFIAVHRLSLVVASGGYSSLQCAGFSLQWLLLLRSMGSRCADFSSCGSRALERRLSSCGAWV